MIMKFITLLCFFAFTTMGGDDFDSPVKKNYTCGIDNTGSNKVYDGMFEMEEYPWMGILYYPEGGVKYTTAVVLVTKQMVLASSQEIQGMNPRKDDFRRSARVVIGKTCVHEGHRVRDYVYHQEFSYTHQCSLTLIMLEDDHLADLTPICGPPDFYYRDTKYYIMTVTENCKYSRVKVYEVETVSNTFCNYYYTIKGLDTEKQKPSHQVCAVGNKIGFCTLRSGTILVMKQGNHWRLLGFGTYGPGCEHPTRFMDYSAYRQWVYNTVARVGRQAITKLADNHVIIRRRLAYPQRFGLCDPEEKNSVLFEDVVKILSKGYSSKAVYNLSILENNDYTCVILYAENVKDPNKPTVIDLRSNKDKRKYRRPSIPTPIINIRKWCPTASGLCSETEYHQLYFSVSITFEFRVKFSVQVYGEPMKVLDPELLMLHRNTLEGKSPVIPSYEEVLAHLRRNKGKRNHFWFYKEDVATTSTT